MPGQYSIEMAREEARALHAKLAALRSFTAGERDYADFCLEGDGVNVAYYPKRGRLLVQGKNADEFVNELMPLAVPSACGAAAPKPAGGGGTDTRPHFGIDESGKGDYFGPLVIAGVYSNEETAPQLLAAGCRDSKLISDDDRIHAIAEKVKRIPGVAWEIVCIGPKRYNELYAEFKNLNRLLAWGHSRVMAALHEQVPDCPRALSDQFANPRVLQQALNKMGVPIQLEQRTKGESDIAVAAASILARDRFVQWMREAAAAANCELPLGCAPHVEKAARQFILQHGAQRLGDVAKLHFKVTARVTK